MSMQRHKVSSLEFRIEAIAAVINLGTISIQIVFKGIRLGNLSKEVTTEREMAK